MEQLFTIEEVMNYLKVTYNTVNGWLNSGQLKGYKAGKQWRIKKEDLDIFLKEQNKA